MTWENSISFPKVCLFMHFSFEELSLTRLSTTDHSYNHISAWLLLFHPNNRSRLNNYVLPKPVKNNPPLISRNSKRGILAEIPLRYRDRRFSTLSDVNIWQPFVDHQVHDTFLDDQLHRASQCSSASPDDAGRH